MGRSLKQVNWPENVARRGAGYTRARDGDRAQVRISGERRNQDPHAMNMMTSRKRPEGRSTGEHEGPGTEEPALAILEDTSGDEATSPKPCGKFQEETTS